MGKVSRRVRGRLPALSYEGFHELALVYFFWQKHAITACAGLIVVILLLKADTRQVC